MQNESDTGKEDDVSLPAIVKPEPRTPVTTVTSVSPDSVSAAIAMSPITPAEPVDILTSNVTTSTPATSQVTDSPSKKKGVAFFLYRQRIKDLIKKKPVFDNG